MKNMYVGQALLVLMFLGLALFAYYATIENKVQALKLETSKLLKEECLRLGGTSVEQPAGNFIKCLN